MSELSKLTSKMIARYMRLGRFILSDENIKDLVGCCHKDELAHELLELGGPYDDREAQLLFDLLKGDGDTLGDDTLDKYADYIVNYHYKYKPEAKSIDPSIDTDKEHIGPMAQDIEKVNPAAVITDNKGYKEVDTDRLALMNAGAIGELARVIEGIKKEMDDGKSA
jgi:hypothetical protein